MTGNGKEINGIAKEGKRRKKKKGSELDRTVMKFMCKGQEILGRGEGCRLE